MQENNNAAVRGESADVLFCDFNFLLQVTNTPPSQASSLTIRLPNQ